MPQAKVYFELTDEDKQTIKDWMAMGLDEGDNRLIGEINAAETVISRWLMEAYERGYEAAAAHLLYSQK